MTPHAREILARFDALDQVLVKAGFPATSPWWRREIRRFYQSGRRRWVIRAGRRGGKSSTLTRLGYVEARWGKHPVPLGDLGLVMLISKDRDDAAQRLRTWDAIAKAVGDKLEVRGDERLFPARRTGCKVFTASIAGVSGPTAIMVIGDEVAKWRDSETGSNPATDVIASAMPTVATQPEARAVWSSSPLGLDDAHARMVDAGDTPAQLVSIGATWECNPTIREADTHDLESDERVRAREYGAQPQAGVLGAFDPRDIDRARELRAKGRELGPRIMLVDSSSARADRFTYGAGVFEQPSEGAADAMNVLEIGTPAGDLWLQRQRLAPPAPRQAAPPFLRVLLVDGFEPEEARELTSAGVVARIAAVAGKLGATVVHADQREEFALGQEFRRAGLRFYPHVWTASSKPEAVQTVRRWFREGAIALPDHDGLRRELLNFEERITPSGAFTFGARGSGRDDFVALLVTAAMAYLAGALRARPPRSPSGGGSSGGTPPVDHGSDFFGRFTPGSVGF